MYHRVPTFQQTVVSMEDWGRFDEAEELAREARERERLKEISDREDAAELQRRRESYKNRKSK